VNDELGEEREDEGVANSLVMAVVGVLARGMA
jgi:hypothetical protein